MYETDEASGTRAMRCDRTTPIAVNQTRSVTRPSTDIGHMAPEAAADPGHSPSAEEHSPGAAWAAAAHYRKPATPHPRTVPAGPGVHHVHR